MRANERLRLLSNREYMIGVNERSENVKAGQFIIQHRGPNSYDFYGVINGKEIYFLTSFEPFERNPKPRRLSVFWGSMRKKSDERIMGNYIISTLDNTLDHNLIRDVIDIHFLKRRV